MREFGAYPVAFPQEVACGEGNMRHEPLDMQAVLRLRHGQRSVEEGDWEAAETFQADGVVLSSPGPRDGCVELAATGRLRDDAALEHYAHARRERPKGYLPSPSRSCSRNAISSAAQLPAREPL